MARHYYTPYDLSSVNLSVHCAVTTHTKSNKWKTEGTMNPHWDFLIQYKNIMVIHTKFKNMPPMREWDPQVCIFSPTSCNRNKSMKDQLHSSNLVLRQFLQREEESVYPSLLRVFHSSVHTIIHWTLAKEETVSIAGLGLGARAYIFTVKCHYQLLTQGPSCWMCVFKER